MTYQERYLAHQLRKKDVLIKIIKARHSTRMFSDKQVDQKIIDEIVESINYCPSSCDRKAIRIDIVADRDKKALLGGLLVGGTGWIHRADKVLLIFADQIAYRAGDEILFMPYLDGGVVLYHLYLMATYYGLKCCFCNPNIRDFNQDHFKKVFGNKMFCGAIALGYEK